MLTQRSHPTRQFTLDNDYKLLICNEFYQPSSFMDWYARGMSAPLHIPTIKLPRRSRAWLLAALTLALQGCATQERYASTAGAAAPDRRAQAPDLQARTGQRDGAAEVVITALNFLGKPYRHGSSSVEQGFDCSGFTRHVYDLSLGVALPRSADDQANAASLVSVERAELQPGDLVFFDTLKRTYSHVGIYVGEGRFIHAPRTGSQVRVEDMRFAYWAQRFTGARRAADPSDPGAATLLPSIR